MSTLEITDLSPKPVSRNDKASSGALIINADDWGRDQETTDRIRECILRRTVSSASAMVFMEDSERAAEIAGEKSVDVGLHLNFTTPFSAANCPAKLLEHQRRTAAYLRGYRLARVLYHPGLAHSFRYVCESQMEQFHHLYQRRPDRIDGHHHMHLCANVLFGRLLPQGTIVRRNFCFTSGEKGLMNRLYRRALDRFLARHHFIVDFFFQLEPLEPVDRLQRIFSLARQFVVEIETHPAKTDEYRFLTSGEIARWLQDIPIARRFIQGPTLTTHQIKANNPSPFANPRRSGGKMRHISVCICTYKRPQFLERLLRELADQETNGLFTYSIVVVDNDRAESASTVVTYFGEHSHIPVKYCVEPRQNIPLARNTAISNAQGDYVALIDDDEFPTKNWLLTLVKACDEYSVDGVLGPVKRYFDEQPPSWVLKGNFYERTTFSTGTVLDWKSGRTGNALLKKQIFADGEPPFNPEFRASEDQDFFRRMIEKGNRFIWCDEAIAYEIVPPERWKPTIMLRRALLRGAMARLQPTFGVLDAAKSIIAVVAYTVALPFMALLGQHRFMDLLIRLFDHLGKLLAAIGIHLVKEPYVTQ